MNPPDHQGERAGLDQAPGDGAREASSTPGALRPPAQPRGRSAHAPMAPANPPIPTEAAYAAAVQQITAQLDPHEATARQTIEQVVRQVGLRIATWAVGLAQQAQPQQRGEHRLTRLEQWVVTCRQLGRQVMGAAQPA